MPPAPKLPVPSSTKRQTWWSTFSWRTSICDGMVKVISRVVSGYVTARRERCWQMAKRKVATRMLLVRTWVGGEPSEYFRLSVQQTETKVRACSFFHLLWMMKLSTQCQLVELTCLMLEIFESSVKQIDWGPEQKWTALSTVDHMTSPILMFGKFQRRRKHFTMSCHNWQQRSVHHDNVD